ncbi:SusC/RagA family TonB-linked outer membrane protein [Spirosoma panaciterrae]|uniref:SusC/RagA family TonB-linked outer membrane protein n=1 Tax=Spirosoma panaciterrae TaxID=496058 RepID=UPI001B7FA061|nr:TonB-dependent receptor [Spirosoma panaciterrae]
MKTSMPLMLIILLTSIVYGRDGLAQDWLNRSVTVQAEQQELGVVLTNLEQSANVRFSYVRSLVGKHKVSLVARNQRLSDVLEKLLRPLHIRYLVSGDYIVLSKEVSHNETPGSVPFTTNRELSVSSSGEFSGEPSIAQPEEINISGKVTDEKGDAIPGASIAIKGTNRGTTTDVSGAFRLAVPDRSAILVVSFVGYQAQELTVGNQTVFNVQLQNDVKSLNEVVVVGYGTQKKRDVTGSVASITSKDIANQPVPDAGQAIQGKAAGVQVISPGAPGSNVTLRVRGVGTINNSDPLLVIDGVPTDIPLNTLNPDDIASIDVLKDASASAIYGSRGANGVVLITTKKGAAGQGHLTFNTFAGVQQANSMVPLLNASQFVALNNELLRNNNQATNPAYGDAASFGAGTDWLKALFRTGPIQNYSLAYSGGTDKSDYYVSGSMLNQQGIIINTAYKRYAIQFNTNNRVFSWLKFGNNLTLNHDEKPSGSYDVRNAMAANPALPIYNADGSYAGPVGQPQWVGDVTNPIAQATLVQNNTMGYNILGSLYAEIKFLRDFTFRSTGGIQAQFWNTRTWSPKYNYQPIPQPNSYLAEGYNKNITTNWDNLLTYDRLLGGDHHVTLLAGSSAQQNSFNFIAGNISNFASDLTQQLSNGTTQIALSGNGSQWALLSYMLRGNYAFKDRYLVTATVRRDGSSRFGTNNKWGTFPSVSVAWRLSDEPFLKNSRWLNDLKLRAGYGVTGNQNIGNYSFASVLTSAVYNFNGKVVPAQIALNAANPNVRWETVQQSNVGIDATFLNNRITVTVDGYLKNTSGMLVPVTLPISTGYSGAAPYINAGEVKNNGIELSVFSRNTTGKLVWTTNANFSLNRNKLVALSDNTPLYGGSIGLNGFISTNTVGSPINSFYGFVTQGVFQTQYDVEAHASQVPGADVYNRTSPGDIRFKDLNNDGIINDNDRAIIGNPNPKFIYALTNNITYKGFDLTVFLQGVYGNDIFNANNVYQQSMAVAQNQTTAVLGRWTGPGTSNTMPRAIFNDPNKNARISNRFVEDGSYLRIKNVTLGYTIPKTLTQRIKLSSARLYASCQNLLTFTRYSGFDPEVPSNGIDYSVYPVTRTISAGLNLSF